MKVFISWSGDRSRGLADILRRWFPSVLQAVRPYFSPDDVSKGARWSTEIAKELEASRIGLLVLTPENQDAPWLVFEAGALAKNLDRSKVCPILFGGLESTDVKGPLVQFQASRFDAEDMKRLVKMMNSELGDAALASEVLDSVFTLWWPRLETEVNEELSTTGASPDEATRTERDILEEVLGLTRTLTREDRPRRSGMDHPVFDDLALGLVGLVRALRTAPGNENVLSAISELMGPLEYIAQRRTRGSLSQHLRHLLTEQERLRVINIQGKVPAEPGSVRGEAASRRSPLSSFSDEGE